MSSVAVIEPSPVEVVRGALARMDAAVDDALAGLSAMAASRSGVSEREWRETLGTVERLGRRVDAARLRTIAGAEAAGAPGQMGFVDTGSWVSRHTRANRPAAASDALVAGALGDGDPALVLVGTYGQTPEPGRGGSDGGMGAGGERVAEGTARMAGRTATGMALDAGDISADHARVIVHALAGLPAAVKEGERAKCERELVRLAANRTPAQLRKAARRVLEVVEADAAAVDAHEEQVVAEAETRARERSAFWIKDNHDGTMTGQFTVPWYSGAALKKIIDAMTAPRRSSRLATVTGSGSAADPAAGGAPSTTGAGSPADPVAGGAPSTTGAGSPADPLAGGASGTTGAGGAGDDDATWRAEELSWQQRRGLAFADLLQRVPTDHLHPKTAATVLVTVGLETLTGAAARVAGTDVGDDISAGYARRLACEAGIIPAVLGGTSVPLDLGRQRRLHSEAQRVALALLYDECAADGCDRPLAWTETHHLIAWRDGGNTRVDEAIPLCGSHHHLIDRDDTEHTVERHADGRVTIHFRRAEG
ncbi:HNH endonuclease signature motif containing protein [Knoellia koreensis]|jgi:hypothetical protein|uniref:DUF222 domain-containing protein n=1 Tax=Knoellia koreensis TaxID=2730921 RepID=A0A849HFX2_9MICO|nr:HNH endonuclease signature motif containing protein [Knoellia sp. DB2414S]NNM46059.1 DUF222 domain-containing protein [Knoellia sp. DB2414S]